MGETFSIAIGAAGTAQPIAHNSGPQGQRLVVPKPVLGVPLWMRVLGCGVQWVHPTTTVDQQNEGPRPIPWDWDLVVQWGLPFAQALSAPKTKDQKQPLLPVRVVRSVRWAKGCSHSTLGMQNLKGWGLEVKTEGCFEVLLGGCLRRTMQTFVELQKGLLEQMAVLGGADGGLLGR